MSTVSEMIATLRHAESQPDVRSTFVRELSGNRYLWQSQERWGITLKVTNTLGDVLDQWDGKEIDIPARFL